MVIWKCRFSNIEDLFLYYKLRKESGTFSNGTSHLKIFESSMVTMMIKDISPIEVIFLKQLSDAFELKRIRGAVPTEEIKEKYDLPEDYADALDDYSRLRNTIEIGSERSLSYAFDILIQDSCNVLLTLNGKTLMSLIGTTIESIFFKSERELYDNEYQMKQALEEKDGIIDKFSILFSNSFYTYMRTGLGNFDEVVANELYKRYISKVETNSVALIKVVTPFGGNINFVTNENEETNFEEGLKKTIDWYRDNIKWFIKNN